MNPLYIPAAQVVIRSQGERYTHPVTGEVYGGTDYDNPTKLAEIGAEPITIEAVPEGYRALTWETVQVDGAWVHRPATTEEIPALTDGEKAALRQARYVAEADPYLHAALGYDIEADAEEDPTTKAAIEVKAASARASYLAAKAAIRQEIGM
jgi:hypothetical protein